MKISETCTYPNLSMSDYHSDCCTQPSLSASGLSLLINQCPAKFWEVSALNPDRVPDRSTRALDVGKAAHALVLGEPEFAKFFFVCPYDNLTKKPGYDWNIEWKASVAAGTETRTLIRAADFEAIKDLTAAQKRSPQVANAFRKGRPEISLIWEDEETGFFLKSRPDWLPEDPTMEFAIDYKTCRTIKPRQLGQAVFDYGYHVQAAMIVDAIEAVKRVRPLGVAHVVQEKERPYLAELKMFTPEQIDFGRREYRRALRLFAECWKRHIDGAPERVAWPSYSAEPQYFETPYYIVKQMEGSEHEHAYANGRAQRDSGPAGEFDVASDFYAPL